MRHETRRRCPMGRSRPLPQMGEGLLAPIAGRPVERRPSSYWPVQIFL